MSGVSIVPPGHKEGEWYASQAAEAAKQVRTGKGVLHSLYVFNVQATVRYLWVYDNTAASGTVLMGPFEVPSLKGVSIESLTGNPFDTGLHVASSTSGAAFVAGGADFFITAGIVRRS